MKYGALILMLLPVFATGCSESSVPKQTVTRPAELKPADETAAIRILGEINQAQADYIRRNRRYALTFDELIESRFMKQEPSKDTTGYEIKLRPAADAASYRIVASPIGASATSMFLFTDKTGVIRREQGKEATADSSPIS